MRSLAPWFMALGTAIIAVTTGLAGARGAFVGKVPLTPYLYGYGAAILAFILAGILFYREDEIPRIAPVRYGSASTSARQINGVWCKADGTPFTTEEVLRAQHQIGYKGLAVTNDGDPAYEIHVVSGKVGTSIPIFDNRIARLSTNDGEGFFPINITLENGSGLLAGLSGEMQDKKVNELPITIRYRNGKRRRYKTTCKMVRDVTQVGGLAISDVHHGRDLFGFLRWN